MTTRPFHLALLAACALLALVPAIAQSSSPGETSGAPLAPLLVADYDRTSGNMRLAFQSACGATDNNIYYGPLNQVAGLTFSGSVCDIGTSGSYSGFNPGPGSYFFLIVGNDGVREGSYGQSELGGRSVERPPYADNTCGDIQQLASACTPAPQGGACTQSTDCGARQTCVANATGAAECVCLAPFGGAFCEACAPGYAGMDCRECAPGFVSNEMQNEDGSDLPSDPTAPQDFRCEPDVPGDCTGRSCGGRGSCVVRGRDAVCACETGYTGAECGQCSPNYERDAAGTCSLGLACRQAKCGGHGNCLANPFGDLICQCDSGYPGPDCGGPPLGIEANTETLTAYNAGSLILRPMFGSGPYSWTVVEGPARLDLCDPRGTDPVCPVGGAKVTIVAPPGGLLDLEIVKVQLTGGAGMQTAINLAALPPTYLPFTGAIYSELTPFYRAMEKYMRARGIRGAVLGISKGGTIIATNGYGYRDAGLDADPFVNAGAGEAGPLVQPQAPFRIASVTKTLTAAAVRQAAIDRGVNIASNSVQNRAARWVQPSIGFDLVNGVPPFNYNLVNPGSTDSRWANMTIQHLLNHHVGFWNDQPALAASNGLPSYDSGKLPFTVWPIDPSGFQPALTGFSTDISYATMYALAALQLTSDPRPTVRSTIMLAAGNRFQYNPGGNTTGGKNYANIGYMLAGRVLEGLNNEPYDPDDPTVPEGWGKFPTLLQNYLCESSGIQAGIYPGDTLHPYPGEPYYRHINVNGLEARDWNLAGGADWIRFNNANNSPQMWEFCMANCGGIGPLWGQATNTATTYGGIWLAQRNSAGGIVATTSALLRFARNHLVKVGAPNDGADGIGSLLDTPGNYGSGGSHNGSLPGTRSWLWQMGGDRVNNIPLGSGAWNPDPSAPLDLDPNGNVLINESTVGSFCELPSDVAVAVMFNQRQDRRAPESGGKGNSTNGNVYGRILDFLGSAACEVDAEGWPLMAEPPAQINFLPSCN